MSQGEKKNAVERGAEATCVCGSVAFVRVGKGHVMSGTEVRRQQSRDTEIEKLKNLHINIMSSCVLQRRRLEENTAVIKKKKKRRTAPKTTFTHLLSGR